MNKALTLVLMLSALAIAIPADAVQTRGQMRRMVAQGAAQNNAQLEDDEKSDEISSESESDNQIDNQNPVPTTYNKRKALVAVAVATAATYAYATHTSCSSVVSNYCAGTVGAQALASCGVSWPTIPVIGTIGCLFS